MGHAGAWAGPGELSAEEKYKILGDAGATMVDHPEKFGGVLKSLLSQAGKDVNKIVSLILMQQRDILICTATICSAEPTS